MSQWSGATDEGELDAILPNRQSFKGMLLEDEDVFREKQPHKESSCENEGSLISCIPNEKVTGDNYDIDDFFSEHGIDDVVGDDFNFTDDIHTDDATEQYDDYFQINDFSYIDDHYGDDQPSAIISSTDSNSDDLSIILMVIFAVVIVAAALLYFYRRRGAKEKLQRRYKYLIDADSNDETFEVSFSDLSIDKMDSRTISADFESHILSLSADLGCIRSAGLELKSTNGQLFKATSF